MKKIPLLLLTTLLLSSCCIDKMNNILDATMNGKPIPSVLTFSNNLGDKITIDLNSPTPWKIADWPNWLNLDPLISEGSAKVTMTVVIENTGRLIRNGEIILLAANGDQLIIKVTQNANPRAVFMEDATPRWEQGTSVEYNAASSNTFITDYSGNLFSSTTYKTGRITQLDGSNYEIIQLPAPPAVGIVTGAQIRKPSGVVTLHSLEIVKKAGDILWIIFYETPTSPERRVVQ